MESAEPTQTGAAESAAPVPVPPESARALRGVSTLAAGLICGLLSVVVLLSFAVLVYAGELAQFLPTAYGLALASGAVVMTVIALTTSARGMVASPQESLAVVVAVILVGVVAQTQASGGALLSTVVASMALTSVVVGAGFLLLGAFGAGNLVRYVPYAVVGGFFAGTGWLLSKGGLEMLLGTSGWAATLSALFNGERAAVWIPGVLLGVLLIVVVRRARQALLMPITALLTIVVFHLVMGLTGTSLEAARQSGWVVATGSGEGGGMWPTEIAATLGEADWSAMLGQVGGLVTLLTVGVLSLLLMASGVESVLDQEVDLNAELRSAGLANLAVSAAGGFGGFQSMSLTRLSVAVGARSPWVGLVAAAVCLFVLILGPAVLTLVPTFLLGALLLMLGGLFLLEWLVDAARSTPRGDFLVIVLILVAVATRGFLTAFALGLVTAVVLFVFRYSRIDVVTQELSGKDLPSRVERPAPHRLALQERADAIAVLQLHGFLFFGTATTLLGRFKKLFDGSSDRTVRYVVVDLCRVTGIDPSAVGALGKAAKTVTEHGGALVLVGAVPAVRRMVELRGTFDHPHVQWAEDLDHGIEWCEEQILSEVDVPAPALMEPVWDRLRQFLPADGLGRLRQQLHTEEYAEGVPVMRQGETARELYFLEDGELTSHLELDGGPVRRLRTFRSGTVVGDMAFLLGSPRSATVVAERPSRLYRLDYHAVAELQATSPEVVAGLYRYLAEQLAERLEVSNRYESVSAG